MSVVLRRLTSADEVLFQAACLEFQDPHFQFAMGFEHGHSYSALLTVLADREDPLKVPHDRVPATYMCAFVDDTIVGRVSIRHGLSTYIKEVGGHIGYGVVPRFRRRGYATEILRQSILFCWELGLTELLLTCDDDNPGSAKTIEACGGVFERFCADTGDGVKKRRYWIRRKSDPILR